MRARSVYRLCSTTPGRVAVASSLIRVAFVPGVSGLRRIHVSQSLV